MDKQISLKSAERKAFQLSFADGLWDVFIGCIFLQFAIAPFLSEFIGDFWSSAIFLPFWGLVYLGIRLIRKYVVASRIGKVIYGKPRLKRLRVFSKVMLVTNVVILVLGLVAALGVVSLPGNTYVLFLGLFVLCGFSAAAYTLDYSRLYIYGLLLFVIPQVGEWLYANHGAVHHGFPISFGFSAGLTILTGLVTFFRFLANTAKIEVPDEA